MYFQACWWVSVGMMAEMVTAAQHSGFLVDAGLENVDLYLAE